MCFSHLVTTQPEPDGAPATGLATGLLSPACHRVQPKRPAHILWAAPIARIDEVFPLLCPLCGGQMRIIAFITYSVDIRQILKHIGA